MRIALLSDVHANLPALQAVLGDIRARSEISAIYHLGDLVGYAPWPNEVVSLVREEGIAGVVGNYDSMIATGHQASHNEESSRLTYEWTAQRTSAASKHFLRSLPFRLDLRPGRGHAPGSSVILFHGTPELNTVYWTENRPDSFCLEMAQMSGAKRGDVLCCGHTHKSWHREIDGLHFVNTGSVGRPKDGDWRAGYVVLDLSGEVPDLRFIRVEYDIEQAMEGIRNSDIPDEFAEYLRTGGMPKTSETAADAE